MIAMALALPFTGMAQGKITRTWRSIQEKNIFSHIDVSATVGTTGFGFDLATPVTNWAQLRVGGVFRWHTTYSATLPVEIPQSLESNINVSALVRTMMPIDLDKTINMQGTFAMNNFKVLVDFFPVKKHRNFHISVGAFIGNKDLVNGSNTNISVNTLTAMRMYNNMYNTARSGEFIDLSPLGLDLTDDSFEQLKKNGIDVEQSIVNRLRNMGEMTIAVGTYANDILAQEDIYYAYTEKDAADNTIHKKGDLRCAKGQVLHRKGETAYLTPDENNMIKTDVSVNSVKPYVGLGYTLPLSKDKRTMISLDAGVIFWGGTPKVSTYVSEGVKPVYTTNSETGKTSMIYKEVYNTVNLAEDVELYNDNFGDQVRKAKDYKVFPEVSIRFTQRIW